MENKGNNQNQHAPKENKRNRNFRRRRPSHRKQEGKPEQTMPKENETALTEEKEEQAPLPESERIEDSAPVLEAVTENNEKEKTATQRLEVVGVRFRPVGKTYSFDPNGQNFAMGDQVIVETSQGKEFGTVSTPNRVSAISEAHLPLKKVLRFANEKDVARNEENRELERNARKVFHEKTEEHKLEMALSDVECSFDRSKLIFYFTSEGRVDFREFVKDMASIFKTRIEMRQIGVRDEAKQLGGLGICGRPLCCSSFLDDFQQVSIKMAKEQNLSLNPTKISGTCGRLMCCLRYENDVYVEASKRCPKADSAVMTPQGKGLVVEANVLCGRCKVRLESDPENIVPFLAEELKVIPKQKKTPNQEKNGKEKNNSGKENQ